LMNVIKTTRMYRVCFDMYDMYESACECAPGPGEEPPEAGGGCPPRSDALFPCRYLHSRHRRHRPRTFSSLLSSSTDSMIHRSVSDMTA